MIVYLRNESSPRLPHLTAETFMNTVLTDRIVGVHVDEQALKDSQYSVGDKVRIFTSAKDYSLYPPYMLESANWNWNSGKVALRLFKVKDIVQEPKPEYATKEYVDQAIERSMNDWKDIRGKCTWCGEEIGIAYSEKRNIISTFHNCPKYTDRTPQGARDNVV